MGALLVRAVNNAAVCGPLARVELPIVVGRVVALTPGKWAGKKRPMASRKREQARNKKAVASLSLAEYHM